MAGAIMIDKQFEADDCKWSNMQAYELLSTSASVPWRVTSGTAFFVAYHTAQQQDPVGRHWRVDLRSFIGHGRGWPRYRGVEYKAARGEVGAN